MRKNTLSPAWLQSFEAFASQWQTGTLRKLLKALDHDDPAIIQGATTDPAPRVACEEWPIDGACAVAFAVRYEYELDTVGAVEDAFARACQEADARLGIEAGCRYFLNWFDDTPRGTAFRELGAELRHLIEDRERREAEARQLAAEAQEEHAA